MQESLDDLNEVLNDIKSTMDRVEMELAMNAEALESIEMDLRFLATELDHNLSD